MPPCALAREMRLHRPGRDPPGQGGVALPHRGGDFTLLAARALEACHRAGVEVVIKSGRRRAQVMEDARLIGQTSYIFEVGSGLVIDGELTFLTGDLQPREGLTVHAQIEQTGAPALLLERYAGGWSRTRPGTSTARSRTCSAARSRHGEANELLEAEGHGALRLVDNGEIEDGRHAFHLIPAVSSKAAAVAAHMRARGYERDECIGVGDSARGPRRGRGRRPFLPRRQRRCGRRARRGAHRGADERGLLRGRRQGDRRVAVIRN